MTFVDVASRIRELDAWHREKLVWDKERAIEQLMADHSLYRCDPKSAGAATRSLELILRLEGLLDDKGKLADEDEGDFAEIMKKGAAEFGSADMILAEDDPNRTLN